MVLIELGRPDVAMHMLMWRSLVVADCISVQMETAQCDRQERNTGQYEDEFRHRFHSETITRERENGHPHIPLDGQGYGGTRRAASRPRRSNGVLESANHSAR